MQSIHFTAIAVCVLAISISAKPASLESLDDLLLDGAAGDGHFMNMDVDGVTSVQAKKVEKLPGQKKMRVEPEIGVKPEVAEEDESSDADYFGGDSDQGPVTNPASTFLAGGDFEKETPKCQMLGCTGPIPNDGSYAALSTSLDGKACGQTFVPMNGCVDNKGYPMGMLCSICCDCANSFVQEMKKTFGYKQNIATSTFLS